MTLLYGLVSLAIVLDLIVLGLIVTLRVSRQVQSAVENTLPVLEKGQAERLTALTSALSDARRESLESATIARTEMSGHFRQWADTLRQAIDQHLSSWHQSQQLASEQARRLIEAHTRQLETFRQELTQLQESHYQHTVGAIRDAAVQQKEQLDSFQQQLTALTVINENKLEQVRHTVETKLQELQLDNTAKLEQMRLTVDEKLHQTLEQRLGESFRLVSERLELVQRGLGEMQTLASGVGDLKRVLANVKTRGTLGEIQLESLLEQTLTRDQYEKSVAVDAQSQERVDFAIRLPGNNDHRRPVWLPIDAKFPLEDYERLVDAEEAGDVDGAGEAARLLEQRIRAEARSIQAKYIRVPDTTDFALLFLPLEGLYAEVLRRPGLFETLQRDYHIIVTGPTTISAILNSFQMGFRTLAIERRSSEVWTLLGSVKTEFGKFGKVLERTQKKLQEASHTIDDAAVRSRAIERRLREVEALPVSDQEDLSGADKMTLAESENQSLPSSR
jgi:DNA recombination protein RmuC